MKPSGPRSLSSARIWCLGAARSFATLVAAVAVSALAIEVSTAHAQSGAKGTNAANVGIAANDGPLALTEAHVISTLDGSVTRNMTLLIVERRIQRITAAGASEPLPPGTRTVALGGRFVIPGLWDMHVHAFLDEHDPDWMFPLLVAHGVTGVRDMGSLVSLAKMRRVRAEVERGARIGPREVLSGPLADAAGADWLSPTGVPSLEEAVQAVRRAKADGADFIKIYPLISDDTYFAVVAEAGRLGMSIAGQVPETVTVAQAAQAGQRSIEHLEKLALACTGAEDAAVRERRAVMARARSNSELLDALTASSYAVISSLRTIDEARCQTMLGVLARHRTTVVPTLVGVRTYVNASRNSADPRLAMLPSGVRDSWLAMDMALRATPPAQATAAEVMNRAAERLIARLTAAGVPLLAGTQTAPITPFVFPGASLHDELIALQRAGLTSLQALQAATLAPARFLEREAELGTVAAGRFADLVVLDGNPATDIEQIRRIHAVIVNGRVLDQGMLDALKKGAGGSRGDRSMLRDKGIVPAHGKEREHG